MQSLFNRVKLPAFLSTVLITSAFIVVSFVNSDVGTLGLVLAAFSGIMAGDVIRDIMIAKGKFEGLNKELVGGAALICLIIGICLMFANASFDIPRIVKIGPAFMTGVFLTWFGSLYGILLSTQRAANNSIEQLSKSASAIMSNAQDTLQKRGTHDQFCAINSSPLRTGRKPACSCGLEHSILQLREAVRILSKD